LAISTNGSNRLQIDSSGNVGIGATPVVTFAGQTHLTVNHSAGGTSVAGYNLAVNGTRYASFISYPSNSEALRITAESATLPITFHTNSSERMRLDSSGRLGLGTSSPVSKLHVVQSLAGNDVTTGAALLMTTSTATNDRLNLNFSLTGNGDRARAGIGAVALDSTGGYNAGLAFYTRLANDGTQLATTDERMRIDSSGRVGIGTTSPSSGLHLANATAGSAANFTLSNPANNWSIRTGTTENALVFVENQFSSEKARIDSSGRLLVGTSTATNNLRLDEKFAIVGTSASYPGMAITGYTGTATDYSPLIEIQRSRGTSDGSYTKVESGDCLGKIMFRGADGSSWASGAYIEAFVGGRTAW
ncbi:MAG: hypothetical protein EBZ61_11880, partial [Micrococcales bacterium]|nr:hypothetical protein [Micrococcales bacterium]